MSAVQLIPISLENTDCCTCGVVFSVPSTLLKTRRQDGKSFWCPNGHSMSYTESTEDKLKKQLEAETKKREWAEQEARNANKRAEDAQLQTRLTRGKLKAVKERVHNGVCPCCKRHFTNLERHMHTKHPDFAKVEE